MKEREWFKKLKIAIVFLHPLEEIKTVEST